MRRKVSKFVHSLIMFVDHSIEVTAQPAQVNANLTIGLLQPAMVVMAHVVDAEDKGERDG